MIYFKSSVDRLLLAKDAQISTMQDTINRLSDELIQERRRADVAVDRLLSHAGTLAITPGPKRSQEDAVPFENRVMRAMARVGLDADEGSDALQ